MAIKSKKNKAGWEGGRLMNNETRRLIKEYCRSQEGAKAVGIIIEKENLYGVELLVEKPETHKVVEFIPKEWIQAWEKEKKNG